MSRPQGRPKQGRGTEGRTEQSAEIPGLAARQAATRLLGAVIDARTPLDGLTDNAHGHPNYLALDARDRALARAILATALRFRCTIEALVAARLDRPLPPAARSLSHLLHVATAQMLFLDVPDSAAVDIAVHQARADPRNARFASLVNAVLREIGRRKERALPAVLAKTVDAPDWFAAMLRDAYGEARAALILERHRLEAPTDFTVREDAAGWAERLGGIVLPTGTVRVARPAGPIPDLPGYSEGAWWVQDAASSLPARLLGDVRGRSVLDLCAAPGGKTAQLAQAGADVTAVDLSASRLKRLAENLGRLKLHAEMIQSNALDFTPGRTFDAVLVDAPCSSTGTVRRHPDVPWTKAPDDVARLAGLQGRMIRHAATLVAPGGVLVYSNCSLDPAEGEELVAALQDELAGMEPSSVEPGEIAGLDAAPSPDGGLRTTPADMLHENPQLAGCDGFYAFRWRRPS